MRSNRHGQSTQGLSATTVLIAVLCAVSLSGCVGRGGSVPYDRADFGPPDVDAIAVTPSQQRISPLDKLRVNVFQVEELSGEFEVGGDGNLQFPLIGSLRAQGLMPAELAEQIATRLGERHLRSPNVQVFLTEPSQQTITVDGAVRMPGVVPIRGATTLIQAVARAQGTAENANPARVVVFRTIDGQRMAAAFDLRAIRRGEAVDPPIYGNDIVVVDGSNVRAIWRDVIATLPVVSLFRPY